MGDGVRTSSVSRLDSSSSCECFESGGGALVDVDLPLGGKRGLEEKGAIDRREQNILKIKRVEGRGAQVRYMREKELRAGRAGG